MSFGEECVYREYKDMLHGWTVRYAIYLIVSKSATLLLSEVTSGGRRSTMPPGPPSTACWASSTLTSSESSSKSVNVKCDKLLL